MKKIFEENLMPIFSVPKIANDLKEFEQKVGHAGLAVTCTKFDLDLQQTAFPRSFWRGEVRVATQFLLECLAELETSFEAPTVFLAQVEDDNAGGLLDELTSLVPLAAWNFTLVRVFVPVGSAVDDFSSEFNSRVRSSKGPFIPKRILRL